MLMSSFAFSRSATAALRFSLARAYWLGSCRPVNRGMLVLSDRLVPLLLVLT